MVVWNHDIYFLLVNKFDQATSFLSKQVFIPYSHGQLWSETGISLQGIYTIGKAWQLEVYKLCKDNKTLQFYMRHVKQLLRLKTHAKTSSFHLTTLTDHASFLWLRNIKRRLYQCLCVALWSFGSISVATE